MERQNERAEENDVATHDHVIFRLLALFLEFQKKPLRYARKQSNQSDGTVDHTAKASS